MATKKHNILFPGYLIRQKKSLDVLKKYFSHISNFLEVGGGCGDFSRILIKNVKKGEIIDFSKEAVKILKQKIKIKIIGDDFFVHNFNKKYSLIVMLEVLEHLKNDNLALIKVNNLLKKDGYFLLSVPAKMKMFGLKDKIVGHYRRYEKDDLKKILQKNNFKIIHLSCYGFPLLNIISIIKEYLLKNESKNINLSLNQNKTGFTKRSGLLNGNYLPLRKLFSVLTQILFNKIILNFYIWITQPLDKFNLGVGYICLAKKINKKY